MTDEKNRADQDQVAEEELTDVAGGGEALQSPAIQGASLQGRPLQGAPLQSPSLPSSSLLSTRCSHGRMPATCEICGKEATDK